MVRRLVQLITVFLCMLVVTSCVSHDEPAPEALVTDQFNDLLRWEGAVFHNCCWGDQFLSDPASASSTIWYDPDTDSAGWHWSWPREAVAELKSYPCLIVGEQPFLLAEPTTDRRFPLALPEIETLWVRGDGTRIPRVCKLSDAEVARATISPRQGSPGSGGVLRG